MKFRDFLAEISVFLLTGNLNIPGRECSVDSTTVRIALACYLFEKESFKHLDSISTGQVEDFYRMIYRTFLKIPPAEFQRDLDLLDRKAKDCLLRNIGTLLEHCDECNLAAYTVHL